MKFCTEVGGRRHKLICKSFATRSFGVVSRSRSSGFIDFSSRPCNTASANRTACDVNDFYCKRIVLLYILHIDLVPSLFYSTAFGIGLRWFLGWQIFLTRRRIMSERETYRAPFVESDSGFLVKHKNAWFLTFRFPTDQHFEAIRNFPLNDDDIMVVSFPKSGCIIMTVKINNNLAPTPTLCQNSVYHRS